MNALDNSLVEPFDENGWWWLPHAPDDRIPGRLVSDSVNLILTLQGGFGGIRETIYRGADNAAVQYSIVLGVLESGWACTLSNSVEGNITVQGADLVTVTSEIYPTFVFIGAHFENESELNFRRVSARFSDLEEWMAYSGVRKSQQENAEAGGLGYKFEYSQPPCLKFAVDFGEICFCTIYSTAIQPAYEIHLAERMIVSIEFSDPIDIFEALRVGIGPLRNFLALVVGRPIRLLYLQADTIIGSTSGPDDDVGEESNRRVTVIYNNRQETGIEEKNLLTPFMLLPFAILRDRFGSYISAWYRLEEDLDDVLQTFFAVYHNDALSLHHAFQSLVGALEAYHARCINPSDKVTLKTRLAELCRPIFEFLDANKNTEDEILNRITATRNYYAHYSKKQRERKLEPLQIVDVNRLLSWAFRYALFKEIGLDDEFSRKQVMESQSFLGFRSIQWPRIVRIVDEN